MGKIRKKAIDASRLPAAYPSCSKPDSSPRSLGGTFSIASVAPTPHSPPMPMPNKRRQIRNAVKLGASPLATDSVE